MKKRQSDALAKLIAWGVMGCLGLYFIASYPGITLTLLVICVLGVLFRPTRCQICKNPLTRHKYEWNFEGRKQRVCSHCNQTLQRQNSRAAMRQRG